MSLQQNPTNQSSHSGSSAARLDGLVSALKPPVPDAVNSLSDMAQRDLDAALQLLADRAQYITGASGAAIALRRDGRKDMLCRASSGSNAPELGALLSAEFGLSGESVRTRRLLRCDDAERDARVNREVCRQLGIASVVVMPVVNDDEVLGVFELFSGKTNAFGDRDLSAVQRLSEMVEAAVRLAKATEALPALLKAEPVAPAPPAKTEEQSLDEDILEVDVVGPAAEVKAVAVSAQEGPQFSQEQGEAAGTVLSPVERAPDAEAAAKAPENPQISQSQGEVKQPVPIPVEPALEVKVAAKAQEAPPLSPKQEESVTSATPSVFQPPTAHKPLLWSAAPVVGENADAASGGDQSNVPPVLRGLKKCEACGFPISGGRVLCVECEEKKWRGQLRRPAGVPMPTGALPATPIRKPESQALAAVVGSGAAGISTVGAVSAKVADVPVRAAVEFIKSPQDLRAATGTTTREPSKAVTAPTEVPMFSAGLAPSQSWLGRNKYILGVLLVVAVAVAGILLLR